MERWKKLFFKILFPPVWLIVVLVLAAVVGLFYAFGLGHSQEVSAYVAYVVSAYALTVVCARASALIRFFRNFKRDNKYISRYLSDPHLRVKLSLYGSVGMNTLYGVMQLGSGLYYRSAWFYTLAGYYALLAVMRYFLLKETLHEAPGTNKFFELLHYRLCGVLLLLMNVFLGAMVSYIVWQNRGYHYHEIYTIALAAYTFWSMAVAVKNVIKHRRYDSLVMSAAKALSLCSALVSMLTLETAMLSAFGGDNGPEFRQLMTALTGACVCVLVLAMAICMILRSTKQINQIKKGENADECR